MTEKIIKMINTGVLDINNEVNFIYLKNSSIINLKKSEKKHIYWCVFFYFYLNQIYFFVLDEFFN